MALVHGYSAAGAARVGASTFNAFWTALEAVTTPRLA
jgi:hypothetical protein